MFLRLAFCSSNRLLGNVWKDSKHCGHFGWTVCGPGVEVGEVAWERGKVKVGEGIIRGRLKKWSQPFKPYLCWLPSQPHILPVAIFTCPLGDESIFRVSEPHRPEIRTLDLDSSSGQATQETPRRQLLGPLGSPAWGPGFFDLLQRQCNTRRDSRCHGDQLGGLGIPWRSRWDEGVVQRAWAPVFPRCR